LLLIQLCASELQHARSVPYQDYRLYLLIELKKTILLSQYAGTGPEK
jgi:hypothetical protein